MDEQTEEVLRDCIRLFYQYWHREQLIADQYRIIFIRTDKRSRWKISCPEDQPGFDTEKAKMRYEMGSRESRQEREWAIMLFLTFTRLFDAQTVANQNRIVTWMDDCYPEILRLYGCLP